MTIDNNLHSEQPAPKFAVGDWALFQADWEDSFWIVTSYRWSAVFGQWLYTILPRENAIEESRNAYENELIANPQVAALKAEVERLTAIAQALAGDKVDVGTLQPPKYKAGDEVWGRSLAGGQLNARVKRVEGLTEGHPCQWSYLVTTEHGHSLHPAESQLSPIMRLAVEVGDE